MKRIYSFLMLLALALLPAMAQKRSFTLRVATARDCPFYLASVTADIPEYDEDGKYKTSNRCVMQRDARSFHLTYDARQKTTLRLNANLIKPQDVVATSMSDFLELPLIPGEEVTVTVHNLLDVEIGGSQLYREYGRAHRSVVQQFVPLQEYISQHQRERGCALFALSSVLDGSGRSQSDVQQLYDLFPSSATRWLVDGTPWYNSFCHKRLEIRYRMWHYESGYSDRDKHMFGLDRTLEGHAILDSIGRRYSGRPTLVSIWEYKSDNTRPDGYELYMHAVGMNYVHITSLNQSLGMGVENRWRDIFHQGYSNADHYLAMRYQVDSLMHLYMPGVTYAHAMPRCFYLLLDAQGRVVAHGDRQHGYRQLIAKADQLKAQAGLPPFPGQPYVVEYLDVDTARSKNPEDVYRIKRLAQNRAFYRDKAPVPGTEKTYFKYVPYNLTPKQLNMSQRLYDLVCDEVEKDNQRNLGYELMSIRNRQVRNDAYQPNLAPYRRDMVVGQPVDLGLSVMWADINVGAQTPEQRGMFFTWGDVEPLPEDGPGRSWDNYRWCNGSATTLRKYNTKSESGPVDMLTRLMPKDDAAAALWQGNWRMPTWDEAKELLTRCKWEWTSRNDMPGYTVTGPSGNSIFMPAGGCLNHLGLYGMREHGYFWTSTLNKEAPAESYYLHLRNGNVETWSQDRFAGRCIRPVYAQKEQQQDDDRQQVGQPVDLGLSVRWANMDVGAQKPHQSGMYFTWGDANPIMDGMARSWGNYRWCKGSATTLRKYNTSSDSGPVDMYTTVRPEDDAATVMWKGDWRMPTHAEMAELHTRCKWEWTTVDGMQGYTVTGPNGNSIFMPASGCLNYQGLYGFSTTGYYWTSNISDTAPKDAYYMVFTQGKVDADALMDRFAGRCIRPVCP